MLRIIRIYESNQVRFDSIQIWIIIENCLKTSKVKVSNHITLCHIINNIFLQKISFIIHVLKFNLMIIILLIKSYVSTIWFDLIRRKKILIRTRKEQFVEISKILAWYRSENNFVWTIKVIV